MCLVFGLTALFVGCENLSISSGRQSVMEPISEELDRSDSIGSLNMANKFRAHIDPATSVPASSVQSNEDGSPVNDTNTSQATTASPTSANIAVTPTSELENEPPKSVAPASEIGEVETLSPAKNQWVQYTPDSVTEGNTAQRIPSEIALEARLNKASAPEDVCRVFVKALSAGDHIAASKMLTNVAQIETARANLELESPGSVNAIWEVLEAEYATAEKKIAQVRCLLKEPDSRESAHLTWLMRLQDNGWKISGMSIQISGTGDVDLLSFENPLDLQRVQSTVDTDGSEIDPH